MATTETRSVRIHIDLELALPLNANQLRRLANEVADDAALEPEVARSRWTQIVPAEPDFDWNEDPLEQPGLRKPMKVTLMPGDTTRFGAVIVNGVPLDPAPSQRLFNHSPDGFSWGYGGSGPAQLALALLLEAGLPEDTAVLLHQDFKFAVVAGWPQDVGEVYETTVDVDGWATQRLAERLLDASRKEA